MASQSDLGSLHLMLKSPLSTITLAIVLLVFAAYYLSRFYQKNSIPFYVGDTTVVGDPKKRWMADSINLLREGYNKFYNKPFQVWTTEGNQLALPPKYIDEVKMLPDHTFPSSLRDFMKPKYTMWPCAPWKLDYVNHVIKHDLNKNLSKVFPGMKEEIDVALPLEFPPCEDWTQVPVYPRALRLMCRVAGRAFVGTGLHRNEDWIKISSDYTRDIFIAASKIRTVHPVLRPIGKYYVPEVRRVWEHNSRARELLTPIIQRREREEKFDGYEKPNDAIEWMRDLLPEADKKDYVYQGIAQLAIGAVSIHTMTQLTTNTIFNLAAYPEYVPILKEEIDAVLEESGGVWTLESMSKLKKMDSFMKETLRYNAPTTITFQRKTLKPITLSDGTRLLPGTLAFSPSNAISFDPAIYPDAQHFDGLRFYKLRHASADAENKYQLTSTSKTQMHFGGGRHACPGRWFASHEIKLVIAAMIRRYEFRLMEGEGRPRSLLFQTQHVPDPTARILFRGRKV